MDGSCDIRDAGRGRRLRPEDVLASVSDISESEGVNVIGVCGDVSHLRSINRRTGTYVANLLV